MDEYNTKYIEFDESYDFIFKKHKKIYYIDPCEHTVYDEFEELSKKYKNDLELLDSELFMIDYDDLEEFANDKKKFFHKNFYQWYRKKYNVLMTSTGNPVGGRWSYDTDNRKPFPESYEESFIIKDNKSSYVTEAIKYVEKHFPDNPGSPDYYLPISYSDAKKHLDLFIKNRFKDFGPYEDAVRSDIIIGNHSIISPMMNIGLLTPSYVLEKILNTEKIPMGSKEAFVRQLTWREYSRLLYLFKRDEMESTNYFSSKKNIDYDKWYYHDKKINILPIDDLIDKTLDYAYLHHIERLMYIGNFLFLNEIEPHQVFEWFQSMFLDSYHVFMYFNVYAMSQHSCGDLAMRKPYLASSNYISKMSDYKRTDKEKNDPNHWSYKFDEIYWKFIKNHKNKLKGNFQVNRV
jgi:deoxyribodipyrimidine photolyase-related protein